MAERDYFDGDLFRREVHDQWGQHERGLNASCHQRLLEFRPASVLAVLEQLARMLTLLPCEHAGDAGDRQREVARDRQPAYDKWTVPLRRGSTRLHGGSGRGDSRDATHE